MRKQNVIRVLRTDFDVKKRHFAAAGNNESQAFTLFTRALGPDCVIHIAKMHLVPGSNELTNQSSVSIEPTREFQATVYALAREAGLDVGDEHTHQFTDVPHFSAIDDHHGRKNALYLSRHLPKQATMLMTVFGRGLKHFQAQVWNRIEKRFDPVDRIEIIGSPLEILCEDHLPSQDGEDPYARHHITPGWEQGRLERLKVLQVGLSGNGATFWQSLVGLGIGRGGGWLKGCDNDTIEASNLPRIPYAFPSDIGAPKAVVAQRYAEHKAPGQSICCYQDSIASESMQQIAKEANIIVGTVDNDGARKIMNRIANRYLVVYLDLSTEIIPGKDSFEAIGQVRVVLPGQTGCLTCEGVVDPTEAALDLMSPESRQQLAGMGYVRGTDETPTPSVLHLNGVTAHLGISQFLRVVFGEAVEGKEFLHYDRQTCKLMIAACPPTPNCPTCGTKGYLAAGDEEPRLMSGNDEKHFGRFRLADVAVGEGQPSKVHVSQQPESTSHRHLEPVAPALAEPEPEKVEHEGQGRTEQRALLRTHKS